ncbi:redoxin family protein [Mycolicibacillus trivialis]
MIRRALPRAAALFAAITLALAGCATSAPPSESDAPAQLDFTATTVDGAEFSGTSLLGKPAVLWFWAPWCPTCRREAPMVGQAAESHPDVTFVGVASAAQLPEMKEFIATYPVGSFTHLADTDGAVWRTFGVTKQPAFAFVAADGQTELVKGEVTSVELDRRLDELTER